MKNTDMVAMEEVLRLVHLEIGYDKDDFSREVLRLLDENGNNHHIINSDKMREYIKNYVDRKYKEINNAFPITDIERDTIIKIEGSTQGTRYKKDDIIKMLKDVRVNELLMNRLKKRAVYYKDSYIPLGLAKFQIAKSNGIISSKDQLLFFELFKNDSLDMIKEKIAIMQKAVEVIEMIEEAVKEENHKMSVQYSSQYQTEIEEIEKEELKKIRELEEIINNEYEFIESYNFEEVEASRSPESLYYYNDRTEE